MQINQITLASMNANSKVGLNNNSKNGFKTELTSKPDSLSLNNKNKQYQPAFGSLIIGGIIVAIMNALAPVAVAVGVTAATAAVAVGTVYAIASISEWVDNRRKAAQEALKIQELKDIKARASANGSTEEAAKEQYNSALSRVAITANANGEEMGLNKVIGNDLLKLGLAKNVLYPTLKVMDGYSSYKNQVPNGVNFFGPKGTGKTFIAKALGEHYKQKGGYYTELNFVGNTETDIVIMERVFAEAEQEFRKSGNTKYTMVFLDEIDKKVRKEGLDGYNPKRNTKLLQLTDGCKDRGVIFISASNNLAQVDPDLLKGRRTSLRIPIGAVEIHDVADMINFYVKKQNVLTDTLNYKAITDDLRNKNLAYKPKEIEATIQNATRRITSGYLDTDKLRSAIAKSDLEFNEAEQQQFEREKEMVARLGGVNKNARYAGEDVV